MPKNRLDSAVLTCDTVDSRTLKSNKQKRLLTTPNYKNFKSSFIFLWSISTCKKSRLLLRILKSNWVRVLLTTPN